MAEFAEQDIIIPSGDFEGLKFKLDRQPHLRHWFGSIDSGNWNKFVCTGCVQSGKSLNGYVIPILYHLFEEGETVVCGVPQMIMAGDKWKRDILPAIEASRYAQYLPTRGKGSRGGTVDTIQFTHGPILKFMSGAGDDKTRSGFTTRIVAVTEVEGLAVKAMTEGEPDRLLQIENRTGFYGSRRRIYLECTTSSLSGRIWQEYLKGSQSQIVCTCPHCSTSIVPLVGEGSETKDLWRESLKGWQKAKDDMEAEEKAQYHCPECDHPISEEDRYNCNLYSELSHGNERTRTFSYRWSCFNNTFDSGTASFIGGKEYQSVNSDSDESQKEVTTYYWTLPFIDQENEFEHVNVSYIRSRCGGYSRYTTPPCELTVVGIDVGKHSLHYTVVSETNRLTNHIVEYDSFAVPSHENQINDAVFYALQGLLQTLSTRYKIDMAVCDSRYASIGVSRMAQAVPFFCPVRGIDVASYRTPMPGRAVGVTDAQFYMKYEPALKSMCMYIYGDFWKGELYRRLLNAPNASGSLDLHKPHDQYNHLEFAKHLTSEEPQLKGGRYKWVQIRITNHWLDSTIYALCALHKLRSTMSTRTTVDATAQAARTAPVPFKFNLTEQYRNRRSR